MKRLIDDSAYLDDLWEDGRLSQLTLEKNLSPLEEWLIDKLIETYRCEDLEDTIAGLEDEIQDLKLEIYGLQNELDNALNELEDLKDDSLYDE